MGSAQSQPPAGPTRWYCKSSNGDSKTIPAPDVVASDSATSKLAQSLARSLGGMQGEFAVPEQAKGAMSGAAVVGILWMVGALIALLMSLASLGFKGTTTDKALGVVMAMVFWPAYFVYFGVKHKAKELMA